nr:hypothetical protein [Natrinema gelatinilyticum]
MNGADDRQRCNRSDAEQAVIEETIEGAYFENDDAFRSVVDRIREHEWESVADSYVTWLLEYADVEYFTDAQSEATLDAS